MEREPTVNLPYKEIGTDYTHTHTYHHLASMRMFLDQNVSRLQVSMDYVLVP